MKNNSQVPSHRAAFVGVVICLALGALLGDIEIISFDPAVNTLITPADCQLQRGLVRTKLFSKRMFHQGDDSVMLSENHRDDLQSSGLLEPIIQASGVYSVTRAEARKILGFDPGGPALAFPYSDTTSANGEAFIRLKPDLPFNPTGDRPAKYLTAKSGTNHLYILPIYAKKDLLNRELPIILTEGEKKCLKGAQELRDFLSMALPGVWCFKTKGSPRLIRDFHKLAWRDRSVYITYDSDVTTKREVHQAENARPSNWIVWELTSTSAGFPPAKTDASSGWMITWSGTTWTPSEPK